MKQTINITYQMSNTLYYSVYALRAWTIFVFYQTRIYIIIIHYIGAI